MVKRRKIVISSLAVAASLITYLAWRMNKRINKRKKQQEESSHSVLKQYHFSDQSNFLAIFLIEIMNIACKIGDPKKIGNESPQAALLSYSVTLYI